MPRRGESIYKRKDGRWEARYIHHYENGKAKYRFLYANTYAEVKAKRFAEQSLPQNKRITKHNELVCFDELASAWLKSIRINVKESTYARYHRIVTRYLCRYLGGKAVKVVNQHLITELVQTLRKEGGLRKPELSAKSVADILTVLKSIFKFGTENGYPCNEIHQIQSPKRMKKEANILSQFDRERVEKLLANSKDETKLGILLALYTGMRIGELCGLRWEDIDLINSTATIRRTVSRVSNLVPEAATKTKIIISTPKTENATRVIPLPLFIAEKLKQLFTKSSPDYYVLTNSEHPTEPHQFYLRFRTFMRQNQMDHYTFHSLRHTFATRCIETGFDIKSLSEILGHANINITLSAYVHPTLEQKRIQMERLTPTIYSSSKL